MTKLAENRVWRDAFLQLSSEAGQLGERVKRLSREARELEVELEIKFATMQVLAAKFDKEDETGTPDATQA